jgi:hypothetical protein
LDIVVQVRREIVFRFSELLLLAVPLLVDSDLQDLMRASICLDRAAWCV